MKEILMDFHSVFSDRFFSNNRNNRMELEIKHSENLYEQI